MRSILERIQMQDKLQTRQPATKNGYNKCREDKGANFFYCILWSKYVIKK